jgi:hypothetical protein
MQSGGALDPSAVSGDPPENLAWTWIPEGSLERLDTSAFSTPSTALAAGRREQHSGRVLHPAEGRAPIAVHASPTTRHPERSSRRAQAGGNGVEGPLTIRGRRRRVGEMANDECGMTKEARMTTSPSRGASFGLRISSFLRHSSSVIRHFPASPRRELEVLRLRSAPLRMTGFFDTRLRALHRSRGKRRTAIRAGAFAPASGSFPATIQSPNPTRP